jgi:hypothetical protein
MDDLTFFEQIFSWKQVRADLFVLRVHVCFLLVYICAVVYWDVAWILIIKDLGRMQILIGDSIWNHLRRAHQRLALLLHKIFCLFDAHLRLLRVLIKSPFLVFMLNKTDLFLRTLNFCYIRIIVYFLKFFTL